MSSNAKRLISSLVLFLLLLGFDLGTKALAAAHLKGKAGISLIPGVFELCYLENTGSAFGMMRGMKFILIAFAFLIVAACAVIILSLEGKWRKYRHLCLVLVLLAAGAAGNLYDRTFHGYVIDFLYFSLINFPIFNVADIYVCVSCALLVVLLIFYYSDQDINEIFSDIKSFCRVH